VPSTPTINQFLIENNIRVSNLEKKFAGHLTTVDAVTIGAWLARFREEHWELGLRLLEKVDYYNQHRILINSRPLHHQALNVLGVSDRPLYVAALTTGGKSGDEILYKYRLANNLKANQLITLADLPNFTEEPSATFIFVDDLIGSGDQVLDVWKNIVGLLNPSHRVVLAVHLAFKEGIDKIENEQGPPVVCNTILTKQDMIFSESNPYFTSADKEALLRYCTRAKEWPRGYGCVELAVVFYYRTPDNSISILRCNNSRWRGLFPRQP